MNSKGPFVPLSLRSAVARFVGGDRIALSGSEGGGPDIYLIDADGSGMVDVTATPHADTSPMWLPRP